jgi:hypothetical protein
MLELLSPRTRGARQFDRYPTRLSLESLESRDAPAALTLDVAYGVDRNITLSGNVTGMSNPAGQVIMISGQADAMTVTDANGHYSVAVEAIGLGWVTATINDDGASEAVELTDSAPELNDFDAIELPAHYWKLTGTFDYFRCWETMTVQIWGEPVTLNFRNVTGNANGYFELIVQLNHTILDNGQVWAKVISPWSTESNEMTDLIAQTGV